MTFSNKELKSLHAELEEGKISMLRFREIALSLCEQLMVERTAHAKLQRQVSNLYNAKAPDVPESLR